MKMADVNDSFKLFSHTCLLIQNITNLSKKILFSKWGKKYIFFLIQRFKKEYILVLYHNTVICLSKVIISLESYTGTYPFRKKKLFALHLRCPRLFLISRTTMENSGLLCVLSSTVLETS